MKTIIKTSIKGNENVTVKESVQAVYDELIKKPSFILLTRVDNLDGETTLILRKSVVRMVKEKK